MDEEPIVEAVDAIDTRLEVYFSDGTAISVENDLPPFDNSVGIGMTLSEVFVHVTSLSTSKGVGIGIFSVVTDYKFRIGDKGTWVLTVWFSDGDAVTVDAPKSVWDMTYEPKGLGILRSKRKILQKLKDKGVL